MSRSAVSSSALRPGAGGRSTRPAADPAFSAVWQMNTALVPRPASAAARRSPPRRRRRPGRRSRYPRAARQGAAAPWAAEPIPPFRPGRSPGRSRPDSPVRRRGPASGRRSRREGSPVGLSPGRAANSPASANSGQEGWAATAATAVTGATAGRCRIAAIGAEHHPHGSSSQRLDGYGDALREAGLDVDESFVVFVDSFRRGREHRPRGDCSTVTSRPTRCSASRIHSRSVRSARCASAGSGYRTTSRSSASTTSRTAASAPRRSRPSARTVGSSPAPRSSASRRNSRRPPMIRTSRRSHRIASRSAKAARHRRSRSDPASGPETPAVRGEPYVLPATARHPGSGAPDARPR